MVPWVHVTCAPPALPSVTSMYGEVPPYALQGGTNVRLLVSPVNPSETQAGVFADPSDTLVLTTIFAPLLKYASEEQQSPTIINSTPFHFDARPRMLSWFAALRLPAAVVMITVSVPPELALPVRLKLARLVIF